MARLGTIKLRVGENQYNTRNNENTIEISFVVNVTKEGLFTTTLNEKDVEIIKSYGVDLNCNKQRREGYFEDKTKEGLITDVRKTLEECLSRELIESKIVIRYNIGTTASFGLTTKGDVVPNLAWRRDGDLVNEWQRGNIFTHSSSPAPTGIQMFVSVKRKNTYKYRKGNIKHEYERIKDEESNNSYNLDYLNNIVSTIPPTGSETYEIDYNEKSAEFFVEMFKSLCKLAHTVSKFTEPDKILELINTNIKLLQ